MKASDFLPKSNSTLWERTMADVMDGSLELAPNIDAIRRTKLVNPPPSFLPFLIYEYGLGELTPYVPNLYDLIDEGIDWQRLRGTYRALEIGLGWIDYTADVELASVKKRFWNTFQLELDRVRDEFADLARIAGIADLSTPAHSKFWRGFHGYDVRPLTWSTRSWGNAIYSEYSGVRTEIDGPLWSFGRLYDFDTTIERVDLEAIGSWIEPNWGDYATTLGWGDFSWADTESTWESGTSIAHAAAMANSVFNKRVWIAFLDASDQVIGYRRARAEHFVVPAVDGPYTVEGQDWKPTDNISVSIYIEALSGFGDGNGRTAKKVALAFDGQPAAGIKPGASWLTPAQVTGMTRPVAVKDVDIKMGESIRERVKYLLRLDGAYTPPESLTMLGDDTGLVLDFIQDWYAERTP